MSSDKTSELAFRLLNVFQETPSKIREGLLADSDVLLLLFFLLLVFSAGILRLYPQLFKELLFPFINKNSDFSRNIHVSRIVFILLVIVTFFTVSFFLALYFSTVLYHNRLLPIHLLELSGLFAVPLFLFYGYKYVFNTVFIWIFYSRKYFHYWIQCFAGLHLLMGFVLLPLLFLSIFLYTGELRIWLMILQFIPVIVFVVFMVKSYLIFFGRIKNYFHFILYLCAQEIFPILLLGRVLDFLYKSYI